MNKKYLLISLQSIHNVKTKIQPSKPQISHRQYMRRIQSDLVFP